MPNDAFKPDLSKLGKNYQILTELYGEDGSRTYLARHLTLNRDVTITVTWLLDDDSNSLTHFAADAHLLAGMRHPNVVPVIEGIWLDERSFAIVRARVRGSTLEHVIAATHSLPLARVSSTIEQIESAISWARSGGVVHRGVTPRSIVFQQGNGRVLLSFEPRPLPADAMPGECDDARTIGRLASEMLSGQFDDGLEQSDTSATQEISPAIVDALEAVRACDRSSATGAIAALIATLAASRDGMVESSPAVVIADAPHEPVPNASLMDPPPVVDRIVVPPSRRHRAAAAHDAAVVAAPSSFGFNARLGSAVAVSAIVGVLAIFVFRHKETPNVSASLATTDTTQQAAGDVAMRTSQTSPVAPIASPPIPSQTPKPFGASSPQTLPSPTPRRDTIQRELPKAIAPSTPARDSATVAERKTSRDTSSEAAVVEPCASPDPDDQHKCLMSAIDRNDRELNSVYARLISALRRQANVTASDPDPDTVDDLRAAQRKWVEDRDAACRQVGERPLYARERSSCFAQQSANRTRELQRMLEAVPPT